MDLTILLCNNLISSSSLQDHKITSFVFQAGTVEAEGLNLTIETLRQRDDSRLDTGDLAQGLVKKVGRHSWFPWVGVFHATANCSHKIWLNIQFESLYGCRQQTNQKHQIHPNNFKRWQRICFEYLILFQNDCNKICGNKIHIHIVIQLTISNVNKNCNKYTGVERVGAVFFAETENICNPPNVCQECSHRLPFMITWPTPGPPTNSIYPQNCRSILNLKIYCFTWTYNEDSTIYISKI